MRTSRLNSDGQIKFPPKIRSFLNPDDGGKTAENASVKAIDDAREAYKGAAAELGLKTEEDIVNLVKEFRKLKNE